MGTFPAPSLRIAEQPAVCAYLHSLNQDVLSFIGRDAEMHGFPLSRLKVYNFFCGRRRRGLP